MQKHYELYIDESGDFNDTVPKSGKPEERSLVGGLLCAAGYLTDDLVGQLLPEKVHCCNNYMKRYLQVLKRVHDDGCRFVIFENRERIKVVNGDITYLNIISEGLVKLFRDLVIDNGGNDVDIRIVVANRKAMNASSGIIKTSEYRTRLEEKLFIAMGRNAVKGCTHTVTFKDARYYKKLDFADIICNTYLTRRRATKFTDEEQALIASVYDEQEIYSVFEDATVGYLKQLLSEAHYSEMMYQLCTLTKLTGVTALRNKLMGRLEKLSTSEVNTILSTMSLQIGQYNDLRLYADGIRFALNYKAYILSVLGQNERLRSMVGFWQFDTDFFLLTMYDHIGNASKCSEYLAICTDTIGFINHSWEHIDYYFKFRIREMNVLMGRYDFDAVIEKAGKLIAILTNAKELFSMIETYDGTTNELKSELLGKAYGVLLEAYTNKLLDEPQLFDQALAASDKALAEFADPADIRRQYQYRCALMQAADKPLAALQCLLKSYDLDTDQPDVFSQFVALAYSGSSNADAFALWHYTDVMVALGLVGDAAADQMVSSLMRNEDFKADLQDKKKGGYPWNLVLWNISRWYRRVGSHNLADQYLNRAMSITREHPEQITMYSFSISMTADKLLWAVNHDRISESEADKRMQQMLSIFARFYLPETMAQHFGCASDAPIDSKVLQRLGRAYLK